MTGLLIGAFAIALIWACFSTVRRENRVRHLEEQLLLDAIDLEAEHRVWVKHTIGGSSELV